MLYPFQSHIVEYLNVKHINLYTKNQPIIYREKAINFIAIFMYL